MYFLTQRYTSKLEYISATDIVLMVWWKGVGSWIAGGTDALEARAAVLGEMKAMTLALAFGQSIFLAGPLKPFSLTDLF